MHSIVNRGSGGGLMPAGCLLLLLLGALLAAGCSEPSVFSPRKEVGTVPKAFPIRPVVSAADAAAYVDDYARALGLTDVQTTRVLGFQGVYWAYTAEEGTGRPAFSLAVGAAGKIAVREFPAMDPEMMWNQKYGHRARPNPAAIEEDLSPTAAERRLREALPQDAGLRPGRPAPYYGYFLFPLCEAGRSAGEAAVNAVNGTVVWKRFPEAPGSVWTAPGTEPPCD